MQAPSNSAEARPAADAGGSSSTSGTTKCSNCGNSQQALKQQNLRLKPCPCRKAQYCNTECQKDDWRRHKTECTYRPRPSRTSGTNPAAGTSSTQAAAPSGNNGSGSGSAPAAAAAAAAPGGSTNNTSTTASGSSNNPNPGSNGSASVFAGGNRPSPTVTPVGQSLTQPQPQHNIVNKGAVPPQNEARRSNGWPTESAATSGSVQPPSNQGNQQQQQPRFAIRPVTTPQVPGQQQNNSNRNQQVHQAPQQTGKIGSETQSLIDRGNLILIRALVLQATLDIPGASEIVENWARQQAQASNQLQFPSPMPQMLQQGMNPTGLTGAGGSPNMFPQGMLYQGHSGPLGMQTSLMMPQFGFMPSGGLGGLGQNNVPNLAQGLQGLQGMNLQGSPFMAPSGGVILPIHNNRQ